MNIDILYRPTALENLLAGRIWPAGRRLPMHGLHGLVFLYKAIIFTESIRGFKFSYCFFVIFPGP